jgi:hypothetical protein
MVSRGSRIRMLGAQRLLADRQQRAPREAAEVMLLLKKGETGTFEAARRLRALSIPADPTSQAV